MIADHRRHHQGGTGDGRGQQEGAGLNAVGDHGVVGAVQPLHAHEVVTPLGVAGVHEQPAVFHRLDEVGPCRTQVHRRVDAAGAGQCEQREREGQLADRLEDRRGIDVDTHGQTQQRGDLEGFDGAHEQDQQRRQRRRPGQLQNR